MKKLIRYVLNNVPRKYIQRVVHLASPIAALFYRGNNIECPVCGGRFRKMLPYGYVDQRENALCPKCLSLERHRLLWLYLQNETDFFNSTPSLLHIAPERCFIKRFRKLFSDNYVTADLESPLADVKMDVQAIPFPENSFDVVFCNHILEHVADDRLAMREILRVLKPGGWSVMLSPINPERAETYEDLSVETPQERLEAYGQKDHLRDYGLDFPDRVAEEGFVVESIDYASKFPEKESRRFALRHECIYIAKKP